jgi:cell shape-determining protein MreC
MKKEKISSKLAALINDYSQDKCTLEEALSQFETLMNEYVNLVGEYNNTNILLFQKSLQQFKEKMELLDKLKKEYKENYAENIRLKKELGLIS